MNSSKPLQGNGNVDMPSLSMQPIVEDSNTVGNRVSIVGHDMQVNTVCANPNRTLIKIARNRQEVVTQIDTPESFEQKRRRLQAKVMTYLPFGRPPDQR